MGFYQPNTCSIVRAVFMGLPIARRAVRLFQWALLSLCCATLVFAAPSTPTVDENAAVATSALPDDVRKLIDQIDALGRGELAPEVDAASLFRGAVSAGERRRTQWVMRLAGDKALLDEASDNPENLTGLTPAGAAVALAQAEFLSLPQAKREALLEAHARKREALQSNAQQQRLEAEAIRRLERQKAALEAFLEGEATQAETLTFSFLDNDGRALTAADDVASDGAAGDARAALTNAIAGLRARIMTLPEPELAALQRKAAVSPATVRAIVSGSTAQEALQRERAEALAAERAARNELERLVASERSRLLALKARQAQYAAGMAADREAMLAATNKGIGVRRKITDLIEAGRGAPDDSAVADGLYNEVVAALNAIRGDLDRALDPIDPAIVKDLKPRPIDAAVPKDSMAFRDLSALRLELETSAARLVAAKSRGLLEQRRVLRESMTQVNDARLQLIPRLSSAKRGRILGFGQEGYAQVKRELVEIGLELRYIATSMPQQLQALLAPLRNPAPGLILTLLQLTIFLIVIYWWSRFGPGVLISLQRSARRRPVKTFSTVVQQELAAQAAKVHKPLTFFLLVVGLHWLIPGSSDFIGIRYLWIIVTWFASAWLALSLMDSMARGNRADDPRASLRWRSLRLVVGAAMAVGLVLSLTNATVGKGAVYNWIWRFCWLAIPPILFILTRWWRERIETLAAVRADSSSICAWVGQGKPGGVPGILGRMTVGAILLIDGVRFFIQKRMNAIALIRDISDKRARGKAALQAEADQASGKFSQLDAEILAILDPHRLPAERRDIIGRVGVPPFANPEGGTLSIVVGDRGLGKTAFLRNLEAQSGFGSTFNVSAGRDGIGPLKDALAAKCRSVAPKQPARADLGQLLNAVSEPLLIVIDDCQRLITPAIGGLAGFDQLMDIARNAPPSIAWIFGMGRPAWNFLSRARHDRILFDSRRILSPWTLAEIVDLIERRTRQAGIDPDFSLLEDTLDFRFDVALTPIERRRKAFFEALVDYCDGNPAIALDYWQRSLFIETATGKVVVRTHTLPDVDALNALPQSTWFVLRTIQQMDHADPHAIQRATDLSPMVVQDALRRLERLGVIEPFEQGLRIALYWWVEVVRLLQRHNMLMKGTAA
ncbi:MAG: hypothetical protein AB7L36_02190 [Sphingomonadaceae bacterium]